MFVWGVLKHEVPKSVRVCIGDLPMYIFFIPTHPYFFGRVNDLQFFTDHIHLQIVPHLQAKH